MGVSARREPLRAFVAAFTAPIAVSFAVMPISFLFWDLLKRETLTAAALIIGMPSAMVASLAATPISVLVGLPVHAYLYQHRHIGLGPYVISGLFTGALAGAIGSLWFTPLAIFFGLAIGCASAVLFWLIRRPDRDVTNPTSDEP